jgi:SRSO17 transposase
MTPTEQRRIQTRLKKYLDYCFGGVGRVERREALAHYLRGLLLDGERKSMVPIACRLVEDPSQTEALRQRLQQAVNVARWDESELFRRIALHGQRHLPDIDAFVVDDTGFPKKGNHSVGVQRQYSGTLGRIDNCQVATSLHLASEQGGVCIGARLFLPEAWAEDGKKRAKVGIPDEIGHTPKWKLALGLIDQGLAWGVPNHVVLADAGYGDATEFRKQLRKRGLSYVVGVTGTSVVWPPGQMPSPPPPRKKGSRGATPVRWRDDGAEVMTVTELANSLPLDAWRKITWRKGSRGKQSGRFAAVRIRTARRHGVGAPPGIEQYLLCEWPQGAEKPEKFYLSNLPPKTAKRRLVYLAKLRWRIERDYQEMKGELGLDHFEGRGWRGFHHHFACVAAAHAFLTVERVLSPPRP